MKLIFDIVYCHEVQRNCLSGRIRSGRCKISKDSTVINSSLRFILVLLAKSEMELLMVFWYLEFLSSVQWMRMQIKLLLTWKIVLFSSSQSMFYCELTPSYKSCTPKFRIWIKVWQQQEKLLILLKGSGTRYVTCGQAISSKRYGWEGWPLF